MWLDAALLVLVLVLVVAALRVLLGPTHADRALAVDLGFTAFVAGIAVLAVRLDARALVDLVLAATLVGFLGTVAIAYLVEQRPATASPAEHRPDQGPPPGRAGDATGPEPEPPPAGREER